MARRLCEAALAALALLLASPVLLVAAAGIALTSRGPILYRARRAGQGGREFVLYKLRTMRHAAAAEGSRITGEHDERVFPVGRLLRRLKIDEIPQLANVLTGEMSLVGPRPEDPQIVRRWYGAVGLETLRVRPGLASPGSIYNYTHGEHLIAGDDPERAYVERLLPLKLALDAVYLRHASAAYDLRIAARVVTTVWSTLCGRRVFPDPPEMEEARALVGGDWRVPC